MARITGVSKNLIAFLDLIAWAEGTAGKDDGYNDIVDPAGFFDDYSLPHQLCRLTLASSQPQPDVISCCRAITSTTKNSSGCRTSHR